MRKTNFYENNMCIIDIFVEFFCSGGRGQTCFGGNFNI
jgi:hypothetical protein